MRAGRGVPSAWVRWWRRPAEVVVAVLLAVVLVTAPGLLSFGTAAVQAAVNANWRGSYDILAFAGGSNTTRRDVGGATLLDSSYGLVSGPSIPDATVQAAARLPGVEWSAPIGMLGRAAMWPQSVVLQIPAAELMKNRHLALQVYAHFMTNDGLGPRWLRPDLPVNFLFDADRWDGHTRVVLNQPGPQQLTVQSVNFGYGFTAGDYVYLVVGVAPQIAQSIVAVDPAAEARLLGGSAREPLARLGAADRALQQAAQRLGHTPTTSDAVAVAKMEPAWGVSPSLAGEFGNGAALSPMLQARDVVPAPLSMTVEVSSLDMSKAKTLEGNDVVSEMWRAPQTPIGNVREDVARQLQPFTGVSVHAAWPGTTWDASSFAARALPPASAMGMTPGTSASPTGVSGLVLSGATAPSDQGAYPAFRAVPQGPTASGLPCIPACNPLTPGWTQTYRQTRPSAVALGVSGGRGGGAPVKVGSFTNEDFGTSDPASPSGVFGSPPVTVTHPAAGSKATAGTRLLPSFLGLGLAPPTVAGITTLAGAQALGVKNPFTAIRVRVSHVGSYGPAAIARLEKVASELQKLGLQTYIVAGSSPERVNIDVPDYEFGSTHGAQHRGNLGWVSTTMTRLGVAQSAVAALQNLGATTANVTVAVGIVAVPVLSLIALPRNRAANLVLLRNGYSRRRRRRWFLSQSLPTSLVVLVGAMIGLLVTPTSQTMLRSGTAVVVVVVSALVAAAAFTRKRVTTRVARGRSTAIGHARVTRMLIARNWAAFTAIGVLTGVIGSLLFVGVSAVQLVVNRNSVTPLGTLLTHAQLPMLVVSLVLAAASAGVLLIGVIVARREGIRSRTRTLTRDGGWPTRRVRALAATEGMTIAVVGVLATAGMVALLTAAGAVPDPQFTGERITIAVACIAIPLIPTVFAHIRTATRRP